MLNNNSLPIPAWIKATGYQNNDNSYYIYTLGLKEYGLREFEIESYKGNMSDGYFYILDLASYVLTNGPVIKDGDTVGGSPEEKIKAKYKKSTLHKEEDVISIMY